MPFALRTGVAMSFGCRPWIQSSASRQGRHTLMQADVSMRGALPPVTVARSTAGSTAGMEARTRPARPRSLRRSIQRSSVKATASGRNEPLLHRERLQRAALSLLTSQVLAASTAERWCVVLCCVVLLGCMVRQAPSLQDPSSVESWPGKGRSGRPN